MGHWINWMNADSIWLTIGFIGQAIFAARFVIQWLSSEREGRSVIPVAFWYCSVAGGAITLAYTLHLRSWPLVLGQATPLAIYLRNLYLIHREAARTRSLTALEQRQTRKGNDG